MKFIQQRDDGTKIEMEIADHIYNIDEVLEEFQNFLRACGYTIEYNKVLDIVDTIEYNKVLDIVDMDEV